MLSLEGFMPEICEHGPDNALMVLVPAGPFWMGLPESDFLAEEHETPEREIKLSAYWIDVYPVTNARYAGFIEANGYHLQELWSSPGWEWKTRHGIEQPLTWQQAGWDGSDQPVAGVSWYEADAFARWAGRRLPTDAEWEKAARGDDRRKFPWGSSWPTYDLANFDSKIERTSPVGLFPDGVSPFGCHDMAGNVNNWTDDWYWPPFSQYCAQRDLLTNPHLNDELRRDIGTGVINEKVDRGGGFATPREVHEVLGCTRKTHWPPSHREPWNGFRTARDG